MRNAHSFPDESLSPLALLHTPFLSCPRLIYRFLLGKLAARSEALATVTGARPCIWCDARKKRGKKSAAAAAAGDLLAQKYIYLRKYVSLEHSTHSFTTHPHSARSRVRACTFPNRARYSLYRHAPFLSPAPLPSPTRTQAAQRGDPSIVRVLVNDLKVPVDIADKDGITPLMSAADYACDAAVKVRPTPADEHECSERAIARARVRATDDDGRCVDSVTLSNLWFQAAVRSAFKRRDRFARTVVI